jgi:hypothetical protein
LLTVEDVVQETLPYRVFVNFLKQLHSDLTRLPETVNNDKSDSNNDDEVNSLA